MTPIQNALIIQAPDPVVVQAPDMTALAAQYTAEIEPLAKYTINSPGEYIQGTQDWNKAKAFSKAIDNLFAEPCDLAHKAHKALTNLRSQLKAPADAIAKHVGDELMRFDAEEKRKRREEEARLQAIEDQRRREEQARLQAEAEAERQRIIAANAAAEAAIPDWERDEDTEISLQPVPEPVVVELPPAAPVRIASTVPQVLGGPRIVDKPWSCEITDPVALLKWVLEDPGTRMIYVEFNQPALNDKARQLGADLGKVIPGTTGKREQTLKRS